MLSYFQAILLGLFQGVAELFPVSSLGHTVLLPAILHWNIDRASDHFVSFLVLTHFATALVLLFFFWRDWVSIVSGLLRIVSKRTIPAGDVPAALAARLIVSTVPAGLVGLLLQHPLETLFGSTTVVAICLIINGGVLLLVERLSGGAQKGHADDARLSRLSWVQALFIGLAQCLALIPGFSRTGLAMTGGLLSGLSHENAARYSFLMATPIIFAAAVLKIPSLILHGTGLGQALAGALCAAASAYLSVRFLLHYFESKTLTPFAIYCVCAGLVALFFI